MTTLSRPSHSLDVTYDFRSDTVTTPTEEMRKAMSTANVGDDVFGEDPTVNLLEHKIAQLCGKDAAMFCATGTMTNQIGLLVSVGPLEEIICDSRAHIINSEVGGVAYHSRASWKALLPKNNHHLTAEEILPNITLDTNHNHNALTRLISLENTLHGMVFPLEELRKIKYEVALPHNIKMHLDGARIFNASLGSQHSIAEICEVFDTVSVCLSKGFGAPIGSVLVGSASTIIRARHFRKMLGGGWRQAGIVAAAALYCIEYHWPQNFMKDHQNARDLAEALTKLGFDIFKPVETNMVWVDSSKVGINLVEFNRFADGEKRRIRISVSERDPFRTRLVLHHQTPSCSVKALVEALERFRENNHRAHSKI